MASKVGILKEGKAIYPFWGKRFEKISGLDPLGQQYASEKIYAYLMPGITNLTNRIRYYGFYCWLLAEYARINENKFNQGDQRRFIRRAELVIALVMNKMQPGVLQVPGSSTAITLIDKFKDQLFIDLKIYSDQPSASESYWKYSSGAFGQYYASSIRQMGLIREMTSKNQAVYMVTSDGSDVTGDKLAQSFDKSIDLEAKQCLLNTILDGRVMFQDMHMLYDSFNITKINTDSEECLDYMNLLYGMDSPLLAEESSQNRYQLINIILDKCQQQENGIDSRYLLNALFEESLKANHDSFTTEFGWYQYRLNEFWQFACGTLFWAILQYLSDNKRGICIEADLIEEFTEQVCEAYDINPEAFFVDNVQTVDVNRIQDTITEIERMVKSRDSVGAGKNALLVLFILFGLPSCTLVNYNKILNERGLLGSGSFVTTALKCYGNGIIQKNIRDFLSNLLRSEIINRHKFVAIKKLGNGGRSTLKFEVDGQYIIFESNFPPSLTNPRIDTLFKILTDLQILTTNDLGKYIAK
jgi:hypothetical protein